MGAHLLPSYIEVAFSFGKKGVLINFGRRQESATGGQIDHHRSGAKVSIEVENDAVLELKDTDGTNRVLVRRGSTYKKLRVDLGFDLGSIPATTNRTGAMCPNGSRCFGGIEYCCGSKVAMNNCYGLWKCPSD